jgi:hypothetical protein
MAMGEAEVEGEVGSDTLTGPCGGLLFIMRCSVPATCCLLLGGSG